MNLQKLHYENLGGTLVRREGLLSWRCPLCKAGGQSLEVMRTCPECGSKEATLPDAQTQPAPSVPREAIEKMLTQLMDIAVSNGANSISMPNEYVEVAAWLCGIPAQPAPSVPDGWLRAIDEALVVAHVGVANEIDTYEQAKAKLDSLLGFHVDAATDPAVNGGWKLVPRPPTPTMVKAGLESSHVLNVHRVLACYDAMIDAAPEAKL